MRYVVPASLRHVTGFPGLGLLRKLRPRHCPSLDSEELADVLHAGGQRRVPAFRSRTLGPVGDSLYPWVLRRRAVSEIPVATSTCRCHQARKPVPTRVRHQYLLAVPIKEVRIIKDRGFQHELRFPRHRSFGSQAREEQLTSCTVQAARLCPPVVSDRTTSFAAPFLSSSLHDGAPPMSAGLRPAIRACRSVT